jgi:hypothetical protein
MDKTNLIKLTKDSYRLTLMFPKREPLRCKIREVADDILAASILHKKNDISLINDQLEVIDSFFEVAREQNWTSASVIDDIKNAYAVLKSDLAPEEEINKPEEINLPEVRPEAESSAPKPVPENIIYVPAPVSPPLISHAVSGEPKIGQTAPILQKDEENNDEDDGNEEKEGLTEGQALRQNRIIEYLKEKGQAQVWEIQKIFPDISKRTIRRDFRSLLKQGLIERIGERNRTYYKLKVNIS